MEPSAYEISYFSNGNRDYAIFDPKISLPKFSASLIL